MVSGALDEVPGLMAAQFEAARNADKLRRKLEADLAQYQGRELYAATPSLPAEVTQTFHLTASSGAPLLHSSVWTECMIMINWVELTRVQFADGTTWQSSAPRQCGAAPSLYVPVTASTR